MKLFVCAFLLSSTVVLAQPQVLNQEIFNLQSSYQKHLPYDLYEYVTKKGLIDERCSRNLKEKQYSEETARINITIETMDNEQYVLIDYQREKITDNFSELQVAYQNGKVIAHVFFDEKGRDYVAFPPFSEEDEKNITLDMLDLMDAGLIKLKKLKKPE